MLWRPILRQQITMMRYVSWRARRVSIGYVATALILGVLASEPSRASTVYSYEGHNYTSVLNDPFFSYQYTTSEHISGSFTLSAPLADNLSNYNFAPLVTNFSFTDGTSFPWTPSFSFLDPGSTVSTDSLGNITSWWFNITDTGSIPPYFDHYITSSSSPSSTFDAVFVSACSDISFLTGACFATAAQIGTNLDDAGGWSGPPSETPIPPSIILLLSALGVIGGLEWGRNRRRAIV